MIALGTVGNLLNQLQIFNVVDNAAVKLFRVKRLAQKIIGTVFNKFGRERLVTVAGHTNHNQIGFVVFVAQVTHQLKAVHFGHVVVGD